MKAVTPDPTPAQAARRSPSFVASLAAHWRGELPLATSFWLRFFVPVLLLGLAADALATWINLEGSHLQLASLAELLAWLLLLVALAWGGVGVWRAAGVFARAGFGLLWMGLARAGAAASGLIAAGALVLSVAPQLGTWLSLARGIDPLGAVQLSTTDGRKFGLQGMLGQGASEHLAEAVARSPGLYLLELDLPDGRESEARAIAALVRQRGLQTRVVGACDNACWQVFMAGSGRQVMPAGRLSLHRQTSGAVNPMFQVLARQWQTAELQGAGVPPNLILLALGSPPSQPWTLQTDELLSAGLIGRKGRPLDIDLPPRDAPLADYVQALVSQPAWRTLDKRRPGAIEAAGRAMLEARAKGADDDATQVAAQRVVEATLPDLVRDAGPALREAYLGLLRGQILAALPVGPEACRGVLSGAAAARRALPAPWPEREVSWIVDAATEPDPAPPRPLSSLEGEVMRHALGDRAALLLGDIRQPSRSAASLGECEHALALIDEVMGLPPAERRLAVRLMFRGG